VLQDSLETNSTQAEDDTDIEDIVMDTPQKTSTDLLSDSNPPIIEDEFHEARSMMDIDSDIDTSDSDSDNPPGRGRSLCVPTTTRLDREELRIVRNNFAEEYDPWDTSMVPEYADTIFEYMRRLEYKMTPRGDYMSLQGDLTWNMRRVLIDWIVQVHARFHLLGETLFLTINLIDRFLSSQIVAMEKLQLVGAVAIYIASKYEEITSPSVEEIHFMVDSGYSKQEILDAEKCMMNVLEFELGWPGPMSFLRRVSKADDYDVNTRTLAKYLLEVTMVDERFVSSPPSFVAGVTHALSRRMLNKGVWVPPPRVNFRSRRLMHTCFIRDIPGDKSTQAYLSCSTVCRNNTSTILPYLQSTPRRSLSVRVGS
jgi:G2/mitotic-specific cyclin 3/4